MIHPKSFIITLGWTEAPTLTSISKHGLDCGDRVILLTPERRDKGAEAAISRIKSLVSLIKGGIEVLELPLPIERFEDAVMKITRVIRSAAEQGHYVIMNLSGGMRLLVIEALMAALLSNVQDLTVEIQTEDGRFDITIPLIIKPSFILSPIQRLILKSLKNREASITELSRDLGKPISTVYRLVKKLSDEGFVELEKRGRKSIARLKLKGEVAIVG